MFYDRGGTMTEVEYDFDDLRYSEAIRENADYARWSDQLVVVNANYPEYYRQSVEQRLIDLGVLYHRVNMTGLD